MNSETFCHFLCSMAVRTNFKLVIMCVYHESRITDVNWDLTELNRAESWPLKTFDKTHSFRIKFGYILHFFLPAKLSS